MKVIRTLQTQIDLNDMNQLYCGDIQEIVKSYLKQHYVGKCRYSCLIQNILEIQTSECRIDYASPIGAGYVNVSFTAEVLELTTDECVVSKIVEIHPQNIILTKNEDLHIVSMLKSDNILKSVKVNQHIPIRVIKHEFTLGKENITVNSALYTLPKDSYIFQIDPLTNNEKEDLAPLIDDIKNSLKDMKKIDSKLIKFFNEMLYPFTKKVSVKNEENMLDLKASGLVCRHQTIDKLTPSIMVLKKTDKEIIVQTAILVYKSFLNDYHNHIRTIITLCNHFNNPEIRKENEPVWQIYKKYKTLYDETS